MLRPSQITTVAHCMERMSRSSLRPTLDIHGPTWRHHLVSRISGFSLRFCANNSDRFSEVEHTTNSLSGWNKKRVFSCWSARATLPLSAAICPARTAVGGAADRIGRWAAPSGTAVRMALWATTPVRTAVREGGWAAWLVLGAANRESRSTATIRAGKARLAKHTSEMEHCKKKKTLKRHC